MVAFRRIKIKNNYITLNFKWIEYLNIRLDIRYPESTRKESGELA